MFFRLFSGLLIVLNKLAVGRLHSYRSDFILTNKTAILQEQLVVFILFVIIRVSYKFGF